MSCPFIILNSEFRIFSKVDACSNLSFASTGKLVETLSRGNAAKATLSLGGVIDIRDFHIRNAQVDMVEHIDKRNLKPQSGALGQPEALGQAEITIDGSRSFESSDAGIAKAPDRRIGCISARLAVPARADIPLS